MDTAVQIPIGPVVVAGDIRVPEHPAGIVVFAHGSGSSRHSPRNKFVAEWLQQGGFATLLMDLLSSQEELEDEQTGRLRFDVHLLAKRLLAAADWLSQQPAIAALPIGYFGASTGAAAALIAAAERPWTVFPDVSLRALPALA